MRNVSYTFPQVQFSDVVLSRQVVETHWLLVAIPSKLGMAVCVISLSARSDLVAVGVHYKGTPGTQTVLQDLWPMLVLLSKE